jgi:L-rhamnose mutarotase
MKRFAFLGRLKAGCEEEYIRRHDVIWPELVSLYKASGVLNMTVFMQGLNLFGYYEVNEVIYENKKEYLKKHSIEIKWQEYLADIADRTEILEDPIEVFHME